MKKCDDKYCPDCGHHLYQTMIGKWCEECQRYLLPAEVATIEQVTHLRAGHDAQARAEQEKE